MAIQSRTVGQEPQCKKRSEFKNVTDLPTDRPTNTARCRVACPRLKTAAGSQSILSTVCRMLRPERLEMPHFKSRDACEDHLSHSLEFLNLIGFGGVIEHEHLNE